jgi:CheY-like chemotaxis protein
MRPKKIILIADPNEQRLSVMLYTLATNGYRVLRASSSQEAVASYATAEIVDLVIVSETKDNPQFPARQLVEQLRKLRRHIPVLLLTDGEPQAGDLWADAVVARIACPSLELLERARVMSARKRGPRKVEFSKAPAAEPVVIEAVAR